MFDVQIPSGEDIPQNVMFWGLPQKNSLDKESYTGAVQDVEIRHIPSPVTEPSPALGSDVETQTESVSSDDNTSGELQTLEEVDYLAPLFGSNVETRPSNKNNYGMGWSQPISTKIILSREQFEQRKLEEKMKLNEVENKLDQLEDKEESLQKQVDNDTEFYKNLFKSFMTNAEQKEVFGDE